MDGNLLIVGAGLYGLITAKTLLHDCDRKFNQLVVFEKNPDIGGVWSTSRIYDGLTTNSPILTYEIPDFKYPDHLRRTGDHAKAQDVRSYLNKYAERWDLMKHIELRTEVLSISWVAARKCWNVDYLAEGGLKSKIFSHLVVCTGLYHHGSIPLTQSQIARFKGQVFHSSDFGNKEIQQKFQQSKHIIVVGAGKSALDLATLSAKSRTNTDSKSRSTVTMVYRKPHWISPRRILRGMIPFENMLFSRFVNAWYPYARPPDRFHRFVTDSFVGKWITKQIFRFLAYDFLVSNKQQDLKATIPQYPLAKSLSGALHVEPPGYIDCVREGKIRLIQGTVENTHGLSITIRNLNNKSYVLDCDSMILATGYSLALPFLSTALLQSLGLLKATEDASKIDTKDLPYIQLHRWIVPPATVSSDALLIPDQPYRNIAFNGFAYSLLNPTVAYVTAHWIADYFSGRISQISREEVESGIDSDQEWQSRSFGPNGISSTHIGPHATLYTDELLAEMGLNTGHIVGSWLNPVDIIWNWSRPMLPSIYGVLGEERRARSRNITTDMSKKTVTKHVTAYNYFISLLFVSWLIWKFLA